MAKQTITRKEYAELQGLKLVAERYDVMLKELIKFGKQIVGEDDGPQASGHIDDLMYGQRTVDEILRFLKVTVVEDAAPDAANPKGEGHG